MVRNALKAPDRHHSGAAAEYEAAAFFVSRGLDVLWPSLGQAFFDFVLYDGARYERVQVKRATWFKQGRSEYLQAKLARSGHGGGYVKYGPDAFDRLVIVDHDRRLWSLTRTAMPDLTTIHLDKRGPGSSKKRRLAKYDADAWRLT